MEPLPPIPTPPALRWREFRIQALPLITFLVIVACVAILWSQYVLPANVIGEVESVQANIISTLPGTVTQVLVERFQRVTNGQPIAVISVIDPESTLAEIAAAQAEVRVDRARIAIDQRRSEQDHAALLMDLFTAKAELAALRVELLFAEKELKRAEQQIKNQPPLISQSEFELAEATRDAKGAEVKIKTEQVESMEKVIEQYRASVSSSDYEKVVQEALNAQERMFSMVGKPMILRSPLDGVVTAISNRVGSVIMQGDPIAVVSGTQAERIIAWVRQPLTMMPKPGDVVEVRRQSFQRQVTYAKVLDVGTHIQPISPTLAALNATRIEMGLPFSVSLPSGLELLPGEPVDLVLNPREQKP